MYSSNYFEGVTPEHVITRLSTPSIYDISPHHNRICQGPTYIHQGQFQVFHILHVPGPAAPLAHVLCMFLVVFRYISGPSSEFLTEC
jgi:hypothetical protein